LSRNAVFLDRDGIINRKAREGEYIRSWQEFHFLPGVVEGLTELSAAGFELFIVTNQRGIALGQVSRNALADMHERMLQNLGGSGVRIAGIYVCPHDFADACSCRKPKPGLLFEAASMHRIDLARSWMVGDSESDIEAGKQAGCKTALMTQNKPMASSAQADVVAADWSSLATAILRFQY
jgi:D-glycero-D-manno-heptose 1,7-bisphosphate phosphatase